MMNDGAMGSTFRYSETPAATEATVGGEERGIVSQKALCDLERSGRSAAVEARQRFTVDTIQSTSVRMNKSNFITWQPRMRRCNRGRRSEGRGMDGGVGFLGVMG